MPRNPKVIRKAYPPGHSNGGKRLPEQYDVTIVFRRELADDFDVALAVDKANPLPNGEKRSPLDRLVSQLCREIQAAYDEGYISGSFEVRSFVGPVELDDE